MIILTQEEAEAVRGETHKGAALDPVPLANGTEWVLPEAVLTDPAHQAWWEHLETLPRRTVHASEWPEAE